MAFDEQTYLQNKLQQLSSNPSQAAAVGWTGGSTSDLASFLSKAGMTAEQHYNTYGKNEGISASSAYTAPAPAPAPSYSAPAPSKWQTDFNDFFSDKVTAGTVVDIGNGAKVTKMGDGTAVYQDATGAWVPYDKNTNPADLGRKATQLGVNWGTNYRTSSLAPEGTPYAGYSRVDPAAQGFLVNHDGTITKRGSGSQADFKTADSLNSIKDPQIRAYYEANLDEFFADSAMNKVMFKGTPVGKTGQNFGNASFEDIYKSRYSGATEGSDTPWEDRVLPSPYSGISAGMTPRQIVEAASGPNAHMLDPYYQELLRTGRLKPNLGDPTGPMSPSGGLLSTAPRGGSSSAPSGSSGSSGASSGYSSSTYSAPAMSTGTELVENRIQGLLGTDASGMYTNQVVRQAADRALQAFAGRGLLNSSMAQQAAQEAAISKATEIATTDAGSLNSANEKNLDRQFQSTENNANRTLQWQTTLYNASIAMQQSLISADTQKSVADLNRQAQMMGNLSSTTASMFSSFNSKVAEIAASDLSSEAKNKMILDMTNYFKSGVTLQGLINGDVSMQEIMELLFPEL